MEDAPVIQDYITDINVLSSQRESNLERSHAATSRSPLRVKSRHKLKSNRSTGRINNHSKPKSKQHSAREGLQATLNGNRHVGICCGKDMQKKPRPTSKSKSPPCHYVGGKKTKRHNVVIHPALPPSKKFEMANQE